MFRLARQQRPCRAHPRIQAQFRDRHRSVHPEARVQVPGGKKILGGQIHLPIGNIRPVAQHHRTEQEGRRLCQMYVPDASRASVT